jgi:hypothetical protein
MGWRTGAVRLRVAFARGSGPGAAAAAAGRGAGLVERGLAGDFATRVGGALRVGFFAFFRVAAALRAATLRAGFFAAARRAEAGFRTAAFFRTAVFRRAAAAFRFGAALRARRRAAGLAARALVAEDFRAERPVARFRLAMVCVLDASARVEPACRGPGKAPADAPQLDTIALSDVISIAWRKSRSRRLRSLLHATMLEQRAGPPRGAPHSSRRRCKTGNRSSRRTRSNATQ